MAITLRADNRVLIQGSKYSYLVNNYSAGTPYIVIANSQDFTVDDFILVSEMGKSDVEIFRIGAINSQTGQLTLQTTAGAGTTTRYAHPESTKVTILPYDQIRFYWTAAAGTIADETPTFATTTPLTAWTDIEPSSLYTTYDDTSNSTGFGWFVYRNSVTAVASTNSNAIPYGGFAGNTVAAVFSDFDSLLDVNNLKLLTLSDKFAWLNEALSVFRNKLNLTNVEYTVSTPQTLSVVAGTAEYQLPADFSDIVEISTNNDGSGTQIDFLPVSQPLNYNGSEVRYYLRNRYIGIVPTPTASATYYYRYRAKATAVTSLSTYLDLPDDAFYALKDYMLYRANQKFKNPSYKDYYQAFINATNLFSISSVKRNANLDTWDIDPASNT